MSTRPDVSVLCPVRDAGAWLGEALRSLQGQTFSDFEVLVQDDGSMDGSLEEAHRFAGGDLRFRVEGLPARGIVYALCRARARARGRLLVRMDADDLARPERLARLVQEADRHPEVDVLASQVRYFPRETLSEGMVRYEQWINGCLDHDTILQERFVECPMPHPAWAMRAEAYDRLGGYRDGDFPEDYDFFLRAVQAGLRFSKLPEVLLDWRDQPERASRTDPRYGLEKFAALKLHHLEAVLASEARPVLVVGEGRAARRWARRVQDGGFEVAALVGAREKPALETMPRVAWSRVSEFSGSLALVVSGREENREAWATRLVALGWKEPGDILRLA